MTSYHGSVKSPWQLNTRHPHPQLQLYKEMDELAESAITRGILTGRDEVYRRTRERTMFSKVTIFLGIISVVAFQECYAKGHDTCPTLAPCGCEQVHREVCSHSGVYTMDCGCGPFTAYCDMTGNWTVFQRRFNGGVEFYRNWTEYANGFGNPRQEYWMGLNNIHCMTSSFPGTKLRVDLGDWEGNSYYAEYSQFIVGDSSTNYRMNVSGYSGNVKDQLTYHSGQMFSTYDQDHDENSGNCAVTYKGAWWYKNCHFVNLNGAYLTGGVKDDKGVTWHNFKPGGGQYSFKVVEMKLKFN